MIKRLLSILVIAFAVAGCELPTGGQFGAAQQGVVRSYDLRGHTFAASPALTVSESQGFYPVADVVWRGDPRGERIPQIAAMFDTAVSRNTAVLTGDVPVMVDIQLLRFHGVTDQTRYTIGGVYNIVFLMTVRNARTGDVIEPARRVAANLRAPGGAEAVRLQESGQTQKVRVTNFLAAVLRRELMSS